MTSLDFDPIYIGPEAYTPEQRVKWTNSTMLMPFPDSYSPMYLHIWSMICNPYDQLSKLCASFHNLKCIVYGIDIFHGIQRVYYKLYSMFAGELYHFLKFLPWTHRAFERLKVSAFH